MTQTNPESAGSARFFSSLLGDFRDDVQLPKLPNWSRQIEAEPDLFDPSRPGIPFLSEFGVTLGNVFRRVTGPEVPECFRAFRLLQMCYPETTENIETTFHVFEPFENPRRHCETRKSPPE